MKNKILIKNLFVICVFILSAPAFALQWGVQNDYRALYKKDYFLNVILETGQIPFTIIEEGIKEKPTNMTDKNLQKKNALQNELDKKQRESDLSTMIGESFKVWFDDTKAAIEKAGRQSEFNDIKPILNKSVKPIRVSNNFLEASNNFYDISFVVNFKFTTKDKMEEECCPFKGTSLCEGTEACGSGGVTTVNPYIPSSYFTKDHIKRILVHEIGHLLGLADQYTDNGNSDIIYSTNDRFVRGKSVMGADLSTNLKCDDIDGFINLIDLTQYLRDKTWSARAKNGWASFCNGKKGYKDTFYKEARVLNKGEYVNNKGLVSDNCVYTYNSEGKIKHKYCPKLWTFARDTDKLTYSQNGLLTTKKDEKFTYKYSYYRDLGKPTVEVTVYPRQMAYTSAKKTFNGKRAWELPTGYPVMTSGDDYIYVDNQNCNIVNYTPFSDKKSYSLNFVNGKLQPEYTYSFLVGKNTSYIIGQTIVLDLQKKRSQENPICQVFEFGTEVVTFKKARFSNDLTDSNKNKNSLERLAKECDITTDQLIERLKTECKKDLHQSIIDNARALCSYFRKVDNYFSK